MPTLAMGRYAARMAESQDDLAAAQRLRYRCFIDTKGGGLDADGFDALCAHVLIEEVATATLVACFRLLPLSDGSRIRDSYSAQFYELSALEHYGGRMLELGRFCIAPGRHDPDILRVAWAAMTRFVDREGVEMLFGCSSFRGTEPGAYLDAFAMLRESHLAPRRWLPRTKARTVFRFAHRLRRKPDRARALKAMPPLLRSYLAMGGWVSDHAVVDHQLGTLHVFTGLEIKAIPPARARLLRAAAGQGEAA